MARKKTDGSVRARVLTDCAVGSANEVVELSADIADQLAAIGLIDTDADAVAYAESVKA